MSCLTLERARELISSFRGPLIISMHKRGDNLNEYFKDMLEYIKTDYDKKYNIIELDVSNMPELCAEHRIVTPCTVLFIDGELRHKFSEYATASYVVGITDIMTNTKIISSSSTWWFGDDDNEEED